jgi:hypothetical protein
VYICPRPHLFSPEYHDEWTSKHDQIWMSEASFGGIG